jgi:hypothetical protein
MRTETSRLRRSPMSLQDLMRRMRRRPVREQVSNLNAVLRGHYAGLTLQFREECHGEGVILLRLAHLFNIFRNISFCSARASNLKARMCETLSSFFSILLAAMPAAMKSWAPPAPPHIRRNH